MTARKAPPASTLRTQIGAFVIIPNWILESCRDPRGIQLYAVLYRFANREGRAWPSREHLLVAMDTSARNLDRAIAALKSIHALKVRTRHRKDGAVVGVDYILIQTPPGPERLLAISGEMADHDTASNLLATGGEKDSATSGIAPDSDGADTLIATGGEKVSDRILLATDGEMEAEPFRQKRGSFSPPAANAYKEELDPDNQIQEQREREAAPPAPARTAVAPNAGTPVDPNDPCDAFLQVWNRNIVAPIAPISTLTPKRRRCILARLAERPLDQWGPIIARMAAGSFCRGSKGWTASLWWFIKDGDAAQNTLEGQYDDAPAPAPRVVPVDTWEISKALTRRRELGGCPHSPAHGGEAGSEEQMACLEAIALEMRSAEPMRRFA